MSTVFNINQFSSDVFKHRNIFLKQTRKAAARDIGLDEATIRHIEAGQYKKPSVDSVFRLCDWMGTDINDYRL